MHLKTSQDEIGSFLTDSSNLAGGFASGVAVPESVDDVSEFMAYASRQKTPITVAGAGTGIVGGRVPFGGVVLSMHRLNRIRQIASEHPDLSATVEAGVVLRDFQQAVDTHKLFYPPDPTETSCFVGGTVATNASGARSFKYGATRRYVKRLTVVAATGQVMELFRGEHKSDSLGRIRVPVRNGGDIEASVPSYRLPATRKHAAGYFVADGVDAVDLLVGSEGTLGVITEVELELLPRPEGLLSGIVFFARDEELLAAVRDARERSFASREVITDDVRNVDARALEYFDRESLNFLRERYPLVPVSAAGAIFFEQEITSESEDFLMNHWLELFECHNALLNDSWFGTNEHDQAEMREFRHQLPVMVNEWLSRHGQRKVSTDMAVPDDGFPSMLRFYRESLCAARLKYVIFGHIGDNHVHVNIMPQDDIEQVAARELYRQFIDRAIALRGTISAEHGVGKIKREYLRVLYGDAHLKEMAELKRAFDPAGILGRGTMFHEEFLSTKDDAVRTTS